MVYQSHAGRLNHAPNAILERLISPSGLVRQLILPFPFLPRTPTLGHRSPIFKPRLGDLWLDFSDRLVYSIKAGKQRALALWSHPAFLTDRRRRHGGLFFPPPPPSLSQGYQGEFSSPPWLALYTPLTARSGEPPPLPPVRSSSRYRVPSYPETDTVTPSQ